MPAVRSRPEASKAHMRASDSHSSVILNLRLAIEVAVICSDSGGSFGLLLGIGLLLELLDSAKD